MVVNKFQKFVKNLKEKKREEVTAPSHQADSMSKQRKAS
jgi:hypothetical protein